MGRSWNDEPSPASVARIVADWDQIDWLDKAIAAHPSSSWQRYEPCVFDSAGNCTRWSHDHKSRLTSSFAAPALHDPGAGTASTPDSGDTADSG